MNSQSRPERRFREREVDAMREMARTEYEAYFDESSYG